VCRVALWIVAVVVAGWPGSAAAAEPLRWKFHVGDRLACRAAQNMHLNLDGGSVGALSATTEQILDVTWSIKGVNERGEAVVAAKIDRVQMKMTDVERQELDYDSASEEPPTGIAAMNAPLYEAIAAGEYEITLTARGEVRDVVIPEALQSAIEATKSDDVGADQFVAAIKSMITRGVFELPAEPPAIGDEWSVRTSVEIPGSEGATVDTVYRYEGNRTVDGATLAVIRPTLRMSLSGKTPLAMMVKDQATVGEVLFDAEAGRLQSISIRHDVQLEIREGGQTMPGSIEHEIDVTVSPKEQ
jgi:hypothetical protein